MKGVVVNYMNNLYEQVVIQNRLVSKKDLLKEISAWVNNTFIMHSNMVRVPHPPKKEFFDNYGADYPIIEEFKQMELTGNEYLIASCMSIGKAISDREKQIELAALNKKINELEMELSKVKNEKK
jgi:hypothetical protein